jgi:crotonobetainyl-CoA:carnitine CoA-transferase CaiB-like acyl-CoA transferase
VALAGGDDIAAWTSRQADIDIASLLQAEGIAAAPVQDIEDLMEHDPEIAVREALVTLEHPLLGAFGHVATPIRLSADAVAPFRAPSMGEHGEAIARELAGLAAEDVTALAASGLFK